MKNLDNEIKKQVDEVFNSTSSNEVKKYRIELIASNNRDNEPLLLDYWRTINSKPSWNNQLQKDKKGEIMTNRPTNLKVILTDHPKFKGKLSLNELTHEFCIDRRPMHDQDYTQLRLDLCDELKLSFKSSDVIAMADLVASKNGFHPIKEYLLSLKYDGKDHIETFFNCLKIEKTDINKAAIRKWLIASVARIFEPGCKVDSIPVFQGQTAFRKSTMLKELMPNKDWFSDVCIDFGSKDAKQILISKWFYELAELSSFKKKDNNLIKQDITNTVDEFRSPYDRKPKKYPRQFLYVGTTNDLNFLSDPTSNRRFWPLPINDFIDIDTIISIRDQLWAHATALYNAGEKWHFSPAQENEMSEIASRFEFQDPWTNFIVSYLSDKNFATTSEILTAIKLNVASINTIDSNRVIKVMQFLKWKNTTCRVNGECICGWKRPSDMVFAKEIPTAEYVNK